MVRYLRDLLSYETALADPREEDCTLALEARLRYTLKESWSKILGTDCLECSVRWQRAVVEPDRSVRWNRNRDLQRSVRYTCAATDTFKTRIFQRCVYTVFPCVKASGLLSPLLLCKKVFDVRR